MEAQVITIQEDELRHLLMADERHHSHELALLETRSKTLDPLKTMGHQEQLLLLKPIHLDQLPQEKAVQQAQKPTLILLQEAPIILHLEAPIILHLEAHRQVEVLEEAHQVEAEGLQEAEEVEEVNL